MKRIVFTFLVLTIFSCKKQSNTIVGTWKMVYAETIENDSINIKNLNNTEFIKIINHSHFAFFNQQKDGNENFYGGSGTYELNGQNYTETLSFTAVNAIRNHTFPFKVQIKGDSLIQTGLEEVKEAGINRMITEKYIRIN
ncbi:hypothetical protein [Algibacter mikhailovii]|uniref:hypothetical protein n=1 Tax=Algibacter mikhailovii TaxID=425498 RepID=UPI002494BC02|nr:hypothetical protein [Algibacter mikhailovii]